MQRLTDQQRRQLHQEGYLILPAVLSAADRGQLLAHLEALWQAEGEAAGAENYYEAGARRLANLAGKGDIFRPIFSHPLVLAAVAEVVGPDIRLSMLNARDARAHAQVRQPYHIDTDDPARPGAQGYFACTAVWMLDDFTAANGATRLVPGTHRVSELPQEVMADLSDDHPDEILLTGRYGDVAVFNGHCWHAGGLNTTDAPRRAILAHYYRAGIPRPDDRRQHLSPEAAARLSPRELEILGLDEP